MLIVDVVVVNVALPSIRADLAVADSRLQLVSVAYTLTFGSLLIVFGRAGDLYGRRRLFLTGLTIFTAASLATGLAPSVWTLIAARAAQGVGAAMVAPTGLALLTTTFAEGSTRNRALGYWGAVGSAGAIAGQLLGGVLTDTFGWRSIFLVNVPIGLVTVVAGGRLFTESTADERPTLDATGAGLLALGLAAATLALTSWAEGGQRGPRAALAAAAVVTFAALWAVERRHTAPMLDRRVARTGETLRASVLLVVNSGTLGATLFFTTLYLQVVLGYSPMAVGVAFAPITLLILLISPHAGKLATQYGPRRMVLAGYASLAAGMLLLARMPTHGSYLHDVFPALVLLAIGSGIAYAPTFIVGTAGVPDDLQGLASGLLNSAQELGAAIGVTVLGAVATAVASGADVGPGLDADSLTSGYRAGLMTAAAVIASALVLVRRLGRPQTPNSRP